MIQRTSESIEEFEQQLRHGKYRDAYFVYCRKSTDEPNNQKNSLSYQRDQTLEFASRAELPLAQVDVPGFCRDGVISEKHSAFKAGTAMQVNDDGTVQFGVERPKFHRLARYLNNGYLKGAIFLCWDRASRNAADSTILKKLTKRGVDLRFVLATYDKSSAGELHMDIDDMFAEHHSRVTSEKVRLTIAKSKRDGLCTSKAAVGYLNIGRMDDKPVDAPRAAIIEQLFLLADQDWSLADLSRFAVEQGFTMPPRRKKRTHEEKLADEEEDDDASRPQIARSPTPASIHRILRNRFYTGMIRDTDGLWVESASHDAIISTELFARVQLKLGMRNKGKHYREPLDHPFRGMIYCGGCGRVYTPYLKKGNLYLSSRCRAGCGNATRSINLAFIASKLADAIARLHFTDDELIELDARASEGGRLIKRDRQKEVAARERRRKSLSEHAQYLRENKLSLLKAAVYSPEEVVAEEQRLRSALNELATEGDATLPPLVEVARSVRKLSELLRDVVPYCDSANPRERESISKIVFSELRVWQGDMQCKAVSGIAAFQDRAFANCGPKAWLSELEKQYLEINASIVALESFVRRSIR